jgi:hypothetical protein
MQLVDVESLTSTTIVQPLELKILNYFDNYNDPGVFGLK